MSVVRRNVVANFGGKAWALLMSLAVVPFYLKYLGIEAYGLLGFFLSLTAILSLLDLGLGTALNRELAKYSTQLDKAQEMRNLVRTLEIIYWLIGIGIGIAVVIFAPLIARYWIKSQQLSPDTITQTLMLMGIAIALQWPRTLYAGGLMGMQRQVELNLLSSITITFLNIGGVTVIAFFSATIQALVMWQIAVGFVDTVLTGLLLWRCLPATSASASFNKNSLANLWRFAAGMTGISALSVILTQLDKIILSKVSTLQEFGYYSLAWRVAAGLYYLVSPINAAFFPRFSQLVALGDTKELARLYHSGSQFISVIVLPVAVVLALFPMEFLLLWTRDAVVAENSGRLLRLLVIGTAINGLLALPLALQFAYNWTRLVLTVSTVAVVLMGPVIYIMSIRYGAAGAAWAWVILNCGYFIFMLRVMHRRLLPGHLRTWYLVDIGVPLAASLILAGLWRITLIYPQPYPGLLMNFAAISLLTLFTAILATPQPRAMVVLFFMKHR